MPRQVKAQQLLARVLLEPATQIAFAQKKGSIPVRLDVDTGSLDVCARKACRLDRRQERAGAGKRDAVAARADRRDRGRHLAVLERPAMTTDAFIGKVASTLSQQF